LRIDGSLFEKRDDGLKTLVGMMQENVVLADCLKAAPGGLKRGWEGRGEEGIVEVGEAAAWLGKSEELSQIDGSRDTINVFVRELEMTEEVGFDFDRAILCEFETNGSSSISLLEFFLDRQEQVVGFFLVDIELAVSGDSGGPGTVDFHAWENLGDEVADQFGKKDELPWVGAISGKRNEAGNSAGNLDKGVAGGFLLAGFRVKNY